MFWLRFSKLLVTMEFLTFSISIDVSMWLSSYSLSAWTFLKTKCKSQTQKDYNHNSNNIKMHLIWQDFFLYLLKCLSNMRRVFSLFLTILHQNLNWSLKISMLLTGVEKWSIVKPWVDSHCRALTSSKQYSVDKSSSRGFGSYIKNSVPCCTFWTE